MKMQYITNSCKKMLIAVAEGKEVFISSPYSQFKSVGAGVEQKGGSNTTWYKYGECIGIYDAHQVWFNCDGKIAHGMEVTELPPEFIITENDIIALNVGEIKKYGPFIQYSLKNTFINGKKALCEGVEVPPSEL